MGYCMEQRDSNIFIKKSNHVKALHAIKTLVSKTDKHGSLVHYSWVDTETVLRSETLEEAFREWGYECSFDSKGNISRLMFTSEKLGDDEQLFEVIAPFVKKDSYIEMEGEDGCIWRWTFDGKTMKEVVAKIVFE